MARQPKTAAAEAKAAQADGAEANNERPKYRVIEKSFIGHSTQEEGAEVYYDGEEVGDNLSPLNDAAQAVVDAQKSPHPDKTGAGGHKSARRAADAASAGVQAQEPDELA